VPPEPAGTLRLALPPTLAAVADAQAALRAWLAAAKAPPALIFNAELVAEEILANVVRHGGLANDALVSLEARQACDGLCLTVEDGGAPFDPRTVPEPPKPASLDQAVPGGLGLKLVRGMAAALAYERTAAGLNRFSVTLAAPRHGP
jgi:anti-sigma regulatory factor (Ser/Thr protein kinase)